MWDAILAALVEQRHHLVLENVIELLRVVPILLVLVGILALLTDRPTIAAVVGLGPPAIQDANVGGAVQAGLLAAGAAGFVGPARRVQPDIHALDEPAGDIHIVLLEEQDLAGEARLL